MKVHHIGYFVDDMEEAKKNFQKLGWKDVSPCFFDELRKIFIQFMEMDNKLVELISPGEGCTLFPKRLRDLGSTPYHICYECENLDVKISELTNENFMLIREPQIAPAIENRRVAFLYATGVGQIELLEKGD